MRVLRLSVLVGLLLIPGRLQASQVVILASDGRELPANFGLSTFSLFATDFDIRTDAGVLFSLEGTLSLTSGPLLSLETDGESATYTYGPGDLEISGWWEPLEGDAVFGRFTASLGGFSLTTCEGCDDLFGGALADDLSLFFDGSFDDEVARTLGISTMSSGSLDIGLEDIDGTPDSADRRGFSNTGNAILTLDLLAAEGDGGGEGSGGGEGEGGGGGEGGGSVPEPGSLALLATAAAAALVRRRRG